MVKIDIVDKICEKVDLPDKEVAKIVETVFDIIKDFHISKIHRMQAK